MGPLNELRPALRVMTWLAAIGAVAVTVAAVYGLAWLVWLAFHMRVVA